MVESVYKMGENGHSVLLAIVFKKKDAVVSQRKSCTAEGPAPLHDSGMNFLFKCQDWGVKNQAF